MQLVDQSCCVVKIVCRCQWDHCYLKQRTRQTISPLGLLSCDKSPFWSWQALLFDFLFQEERADLRLRIYNSVQTQSRICYANLCFPQEIVIKEIVFVSGISFVAIRVTAGVFHPPHFSFLSLYFLNLYTWVQTWCSCFVMVSLRTAAELWSDNKVSAAKLVV